MSKNFPNIQKYNIIVVTGGAGMGQRRKDSRREPVITDLEALVLKDRLLRKIKEVIDFRVNW